MTRRQFATLLAYLTAGTALSRLHAEQKDEPMTWVGVSADTLAGANLNDARAALRVWQQELQRTLGLKRTDFIPDIFVPSAQMVQMIRQGKVDCVLLTAFEYAQVADLLDSDWVGVEDYVDEGLEYVLVVHRASGFNRVSDLRSKQLIVHRHRVTSLLMAWVNTLLNANGLPWADHFFSSQLSRDSVQKVILPVFFRQADAAALAKRDLELAGELNPQLSADLRTLAVSPQLVPLAFFFRRGCKTEDKQRFKDSLVKLKTVPAGQMVMELYQTRGFTLQAGSIMKGTVELMQRYERIFAHEEKVTPKRSHS
jgi:ABC-type phosphate/phosphonate transport system substrate-binding protein